MGNAKIAYDLITKSSLTARHVSALICIWKCNIPLKLICFIWLCLENRINTWDNLIKRGWVGPNRCCLCRNEEESVNHLFSAFSFTGNIINCLCGTLHRTMDWNETTFVGNLDLCFSSEKEFLHLPLFISWYLWLTTNSVIF